MAEQNNDTKYVSPGDFSTDDNCCNDKGQSHLLYGKHETEVSAEGGADQNSRLAGCKKNPGHTKFVPVNDFTINHLPEGHHENDLVELIHAAAGLSVRVDVKTTSADRPEFWPDSTEPYAFYNMRGSGVKRLGTGMVWYVNKWTEEDDKGTCPCDMCQHSDTASKVWGKVSLFTATHVVFDELEARHTSCRLFYDGEDSPMVTLDGWTVHEANIEEDRCMLVRMVCDVDLLDKLDKMVSRWSNLWIKVNNKYASSRERDKLSFMVSHPHGCPKQISVGHWVQRLTVSTGRTKYTYTTCTCPGSSGAHVHFLGYDWFYYDRHVHTGVNLMGDNFCGFGRDMYFEQVNNDEMNFEQVNNDEMNFEQVNNDEMNFEQVNNDETNFEQVNNDEINFEQVNNNEMNFEQVHSDEINFEQVINQEMNFQ